MNRFLTLLLVFASCSTARAALPTFQNFDQDHFLTNGTPATKKIQIRAPNLWTNDNSISGGGAYGRLTPAPGVNQRYLYPTNFYGYGWFGLEPQLRFLTPGTTAINTTDFSSWILFSTDSDPANVSITLTDGNAFGQELKLMSMTNTPFNGKFTLAANSPLPGGGVVKLNFDQDWYGMNGASLDLVWMNPDWWETGRWHAGTNAAFFTTNVFNTIQVTNLTVISNITVRGKTIIVDGTNVALMNPTIGYVPVKASTNAFADSPVSVPVIGGTNINLAGRVYFDGTTNELYRSAQDLVYENGGIAPRITVVNGFGETLSMTARNGSGGQFISSQPVMYWGISGGNGTMEMSSTSLIPGTDGALSLSKTNLNKFWADMVLSGTGTFSGADDHVGNFERMNVTHTGTSIVFDSRSGGTGSAVDFLWQSNGVDIAKIALNSGYTGAGTLFLADDGTYKAGAGGGAVGANPSATIGLSAINGAAATFLRSDGAPALSQAIAPTWTEVHQYAKNVGAILAVGDTEFVDVQRASQTNLISGTLTFAHATNGTHGTEWVHVRTFLNGSGSDQTVNLPAGWIKSTGAASSFVVTNNTMAKMYLNCMGPTADAASQTNITVTVQRFPDSGSSSGGGSAPVGTVVNTGASTVGAVPAYSDTTGTNVAPSSVTVSGSSITVGNSTLTGSITTVAEDIAASDIDVSTGNTFSKSLVANTVFTFSNLANGQRWTVILTNGASWTVTWPTVTWMSGSAPVMDTGAGVVNIFSFMRQNGVTFGDVSQGSNANLDALAAGITGIVVGDGSTYSAISIGDGLTNSAGTLKIAIAAGSNITLSTNNGVITITGGASSAYTYVISAVSGSANPVDATTYYFGGGATFWNNANIGRYDYVVPTTGTLISYNVYVYGVAGGTEDVTYEMDYDGGTTFGTTTADWVSFPVRTSVSGLTQAVVAGHRLALKIVTPTWGTDPTGVIVGWNAVISVP